MTKFVAGGVLAGIALATALLFLGYGIQSGTAQTKKDQIFDLKTPLGKQADNQKELDLGVSPDDIPFGFLRSQFKATAYCLKGRTASGKMVSKGIVAADPKVLPLGSKIKILEGPFAGDYLVADTGGKIKGNKIDIWMPSCTEAIKFGFQRLMLQIPDRRAI